jgi:hypothetical protein
MRPGAGAAWKSPAPADGIDIKVAREATRLALKELDQRRNPLRLLDYGMERHAEAW